MEAEGIWEGQVRNLEALCGFGDLGCKTAPSRVLLALLAEGTIKRGKEERRVKGEGGGLDAPLPSSNFPRPLPPRILRRGRPSQLGPFWELCEEIRGSTGSRLNEPSGGGQRRGPHTGGTAPSPTPAQLLRSIIPRGESRGRRTNGPTTESAGRSGDGLKGGVGFNFLKRIIGGGLFFLGQGGVKKRGGRRKEGGKVRRNTTHLSIHR